MSITTELEAIKVLREVTVENFGSIKPLKEYKWLNGQVDLLENAVRNAQSLKETVDELKAKLRKNFKEKYEDEIKQFGEEYIEEHSEDYFDGYTAVTGNSISEVFEVHYEEFVDMYAEHIGEEL